VPAPNPKRVVQPVDRTDGLVAGGVALAAAAVFLATFSSHVALGDAPETVAGVRALGILHAPGYVTYVVAARLFGEVVRVGSWTFRVNLFSVVCAALTVAFTYLLGRAFTANRTGSVVGAFALATTASFWFNAGFAKHYAFTALLVVLSALLVLRWQERGRTVLLVAAAALIGLSLGAGWQVVFVTAAGLVVLLARGPRRPGPAAAIGAAAALVVAIVAVCVFIVVRAGQNPTINFGAASNLSRLHELLSTSDFGGSRKASGAGQITSASKGVVSYAVVIARDMGLGAIFTGVLGIFDVVQRRRWDHGLFLAVAGVGNIIAVAAFASLDHVIGFYSGITAGGLLIDAYVVVAVLAALGTTLLTHTLGLWATPTRPSSDRRLVTAARMRITCVVVVAIAVIAPSLIVHFRYADHHGPALADRYTSRVFAALPRDSVLLSGGFEFAQPFVYSQQVDSQRPDVAVVSADMIVNGWYREQLVRELGLDRSLLKETSANWVVRFVAAIRAKRRVFADTYAMYDGKGLFAYRAAGFVGEIVDGKDGKPGAQPATGSNVEADLQKASAALVAADVADGLAGKRYLRFPNLALYFFHERAHVELAKQFDLYGDFFHAAQELNRARAALPNDISPDLGPAVQGQNPDAERFLYNL
jgi:hypothetical protein